MTEKRKGPTQGVRLVEVSVKKELIVQVVGVNFACIKTKFMSKEVFVT